jgi:hypothetical protein
MPEKEFKIWLEDGLVLAWRDSGSGGISSFRVVLLAEIDGEIYCVARYDTAHGVPHQDILGLKGGLLAKNWFFEYRVAGNIQKFLTTDYTNGTNNRESRRGRIGRNTSPFGDLFLVFASPLLSL